ncbi:transmembrane protein 248 isoform X2 [Engraulis encrasicolus]|uniref:transmembrane protein 248 isoform X2 n=1 Tax=Engraulis encrasicolus TaxID=184585 RepID=UPI002FD2EDB3
MDETTPQQIPTPSPQPESMGKWTPMSNLRSYLEHHPPAVIFYLCMVVMSMTFIGFGFYTQTSRVKNPDVVPDWNQLLGSIASLRFCLPSNGSGSGDVENAAAPKEKSNGQPGDPKIIQRSLLVPLVFTGNPDATNNIFSATLFGHQVGVKGEAGKQLFNMSLISYPQTQTSSSKQDGSSDKRLTCLQLRAPESMLPKSPSPTDCPWRQDVANDRLSVRAVPMDRSKNVPSSFHCLTLEFTPDDELTPFLSQEEKTLVGQHLLMASAALLVICGLLCFTASLPCCRSRRYHGTDLGLQKDM